MFVPSESIYADLHEHFEDVIQKAHRARIKIHDLSANDVLEAVAQGEADFGINFIGSQEPGRNLAPVLTWNIWWIGLIFLVLFAGNLWCYMCPWTAIPDWVMRRSLTKVRAVASLSKKYPRFRLWMWPAIVLFAFVTWLEIIFDAANRPWLTSLFGIFMVLLSWGLLVVYERKAMCRYVCFVGRVSGQYSMMGMLELRRRDPEVCRSCTTKDCYRGSERGYPCPTHEFMGAMNENQYCTLCTECVKSCPHDNIALNARSSGADILFGPLVGGRGQAQDPDVSAVTQGGDEARDGRADRSDVEDLVREVYARVPPGERG